jgi:arsenical pump membrane protein
MTKAGATDEDSAAKPARPGGGSAASQRRLGWLLAGLGIVGAGSAALARPAAARLALGPDWPPFVLVAGLLLIGLVANEDGLFSAAGHQLARASRSGSWLFLSTAVMVGVVTALLNLDTSVAFLTPVLVYTARSRGGGEAPLVYGCLLFSNAGSLLLPGSNLTNLIVLGHLHLTGGRFFARMWLPWLGALAATWAVLGLLERRSLGFAAADPTPPARPVLGLGLAAVVVATCLVVVLRSPAVPVAAVGAAAILIRLAQRKVLPRQAAEVVGVPVLAGLLGIAVALGTLGRVWPGPAALLAHLGNWATAAVAAVTSVLVNNLPAASVLAARTPVHPYALLIGLDIGPNLFVTGSLAWILWYRAARTAGARPSIGRASLLGAATVPLSMAVALAALMLTGSH